MNTGDRYHTIRRIELAGGDETGGARNLSRQGRFDDFGSVESGKVADLVLLEQNPLSDIDNTHSIVAVLQAGEYLDSEAVAELRRLPR